jgi:hypothetical protein
LAYVVKRNGKKWLYHKNRDGSYITPIDLGYVTDDEAEMRVLQWKIDHGKNPEQRENRTMLSVYEEYLKEDFSPKTKWTQEQVLTPFVETIPTVRHLTEQKIQAWEDHLRNWRWGKKKDRRLSDDTRAIRLRTIKSFIGWMIKKKIIRDWPCRINVPAGRKDAGRDIYALVPAFLKAMPERSRGAVTMIFYGGFRLTAVLSLQCEWFDHTNNTVTLPTWLTKNKDPLVVVLPKKAMEYVPMDCTGPAWGTLTENELRVDWKKAKKAIGLRGRFRIHDGRVTSASEVWRQRKDIKLLQERFGWRDMKTALHYVKVLEEEHREAAEMIRFGERSQNGNGTKSGKIEMGSIHDAGSATSG